MSEPIRLWGSADDPYFVRSEPSPYGEGYHEYAALPRAEYDALIAQRDGTTAIVEGVILEIAMLFAKRRCSGQVYMDGKHNPTPTEMKLAREVFDLARSVHARPTTAER